MAGALRRVLFKADHVLFKFLPEVIKDRDKELHATGSIRTLQSVKARDVLFLLPKDDAEHYKGLVGMSSCIFVALSNFMPATGEIKAHVLFQSLSGEVVDIKDEEAKSGSVLLYLLNRNEVFVYLTMGCLQRAPYRGLNTNAEFALRTLCSKNYLDEGDVQPVTAELEAAAVLIEDFLLSLSANMESYEAETDVTFDPFSFVMFKGMSDNRAYVAQVITVDKEQIIINGHSSEVRLLTCFIYEQRVHVENMA